MGLVEADYAWITRQLVGLADRHAQGRLVSCLEGGYHLDALARSVAAHLRALAGVQA
jgi:acetoin utilization deacetylase AcuC-like enzyme